MDMLRLFKGNAVADFFLENTFMEAHNLIADFDAKKLLGAIETFIEHAVPEVLDSKVTSSTKVTQTGYANMRKALPRGTEYKLEKIAVKSVDWVNWRKVTHTTYLFGKGIGKVAAKYLNPISDCKLAWDAGTYLGCLFNCR